MYGNMDAALFWLKLLFKYWIKEFDMKRIQSDSWIFYKKYYEGKLDLLMFVRLDDVFMAGKPEPFEKIKDMIKLKFNIQ